MQATLDHHISHKSGRKEGIVFNRPTLSKQDIKSVMECLIQDEVGTGIIVQNYEKEFASVFEFKKAISAYSVTAAYHIALLSIGAVEGDQIIMSSISPLPALDALSQVKCEPVIIDVERDSFHPSDEAIIACINEKTRVVILSYPYGSFKDYSALRGKIESLNKGRSQQIIIMEDISYNIGTDFNGTYVGGHADIAIVGLNEDMLMTVGKGAMLLTDSKNIYTAARDLRVHGSDQPYRPRYDYSITSYQAAMGMEQLSQLSIVSARRKKIGEKYIEAIAGTNQLKSYFKTPVADLYASFPVISGKNLEYMERYFQSLNIETRRVVPFGPLHGMLGLPQSDFPNAQKLYERALLLPVYPHLTKGNIERIITAIRSFY